MTTLKTGVWGGPHVNMNVTETGAELEFDCANGTIGERIELDAEGRFDVRGSYTPEPGGAVTDKTPAKHLQARYRGQVTGQKLTMTITLVETDNTFEPYSLTYGTLARLEKCY